MCQWKSVFPLIGSLALPLCAFSATIDFSSQRTTFYRDEAPTLTANISGELPKESTLEVTLGGRSLQRTPAREGETTFSLPSRLFRSGRYDLALRLLDADGQPLASRSTSIRFAKRPAPDALRNWLWSSGRGVSENWQFYKDHGFDFASGPMLPYSGESVDARLQAVQEGLNEALPNEMLVSVKPNGGLWKRDFGLFPPEGEDIHYINASRHGDRFYNPFSPAVAEKQNEANRRFMEAIKDYPNVTLAWTDLEIQDSLTKANLNREGREKMARELGFTEEEIGEPEYTARQVIADNDRRYRSQKYIFQGGNGVQIALKRMVEAVKAVRPDILTMTDPFRHVPLYDVYPSVDMIHTWTYTNPDPKYMLYIEQLRAACKPRGQIPLQVVTLLNYPGMLDVPKLREQPPPRNGEAHREWMAMGPDRVKEVTWINLSRAPQFVSYFYGSEIDPVKYQDDTYRIPPETSDAIGELAEKVFRPYGRMIRKLEVSPRRIAVLNSLAASLYGRSPHHGQGVYANYRTLPFQVILEMAHYNADVLFDESIEQGALDHYDVLFLPRCDALTQTVYEKIQAFRKRGGLIFSDQYLGPELDVAHRFEFDFTYRAKVSARANAMGLTYAEWDDHVEKEGKKVDLQKVLGVPAHKDQEIMESYAKNLKSVVRGKVPHLVDCDESTVLFNLCESNGVRYLFVINDKREYDARSGRFMGIMEKQVPQTVDVRLRHADDTPLVAYDLLARKELPVEHKDGKAVFPVALDALGGRIIALYPAKLDKLTVSAEASEELGSETVLSVTLRVVGDKPAPGLQPVRVDIMDAKGNMHEDSDWICLENGQGNLSFIPAWNDPAGKWKIKVTDLTAGLSAETFIAIKPTETP